MIKDDFLIIIKGVPERQKLILDTISKLKQNGYSNIEVMMDNHYFGGLWNSRKIFKDLSNRDLSGKYIMYLTDDVYFKDNFFEELEYIIDNNDGWDVLGLFCNRDLSKKKPWGNGNIVLSSPSAIYDPCMIFNKDVLNKEICEEILLLSETSDSKRLRLHFDMCIFKVLELRKLVCISAYPTLALTHSVRSIMGHNLTYRETVEEYEASRAKELV